MSTYADKGHIFAELTASGDSCDHTHSLISKLSGTFIKAGWDVEPVSAVVKVLTGEEAFVISFCVAGIHTPTVYSFDFDGTVAPKPWPIVIDDLALCCDGACQQSLLDRGFAPIITLPSNPTVGETHVAALEGLSRMYLNIGVLTRSLFFEILQNGDHVTQIELIDQSSCVPRITFGNAMATNTVGEAPRGSGFIARSKESIQNGNKIELYITYEELLFTAVEQRLVIYTRIGGWPTLGGIEGHPAFIAEKEENDKVSKTIIDGTEDIRCFINEFQIALDQPNAHLSQFEGKYFGGAIKLKALEGEDENLRNITKATISVGSVFGSKLRDMSNQLGPYTVELEGDFANVNIAGTFVDTGLGGPLILNGICESMPFNASYPNGISWLGGAAQIWEPWIACNPNDLKAPAPCIGQIWDAIMIYRNINLSVIDTAPNELFQWDGKFWRYFQVDRETATQFQANVFLSGPASSMAFRVDDPRVWVGGGFIGEDFGEILSISFATNPVASGDSVVITVTLTEAAGSGGFIIYIQAFDSSRCQFDGSPGYVVRFTEGEIFQNIPMSTVDLEILETVEIRATGSNSVSETLTLAA